MNRMKRWAENVLYIENLREEAQAWCKVRGYGGRVPVNGWLTELDDGKVRLMVFDLDEHGSVKFDFDRDLPVMRWAQVDGPMPAAHLIEDATGTTVDDWAQSISVEQ